MTEANQFDRPVDPGDHDAIHALVTLAFGQPDEADLVRRLRADGAMWRETATWIDGRLAGYVALSRMVAPLDWACLAPLAVHPDFQGQRIGMRLVTAIADAARLGQPERMTVVVLGDPEFYGRAGFSLERARNLSSPYPVSHTLIAGPGDDVPAERLVYPAAFDGLD
ncbi:MAG: N-acetyltransferase [Pseudomonadota bacterium]|nr:N-acetyltransferase [Pseudomonadota bacterium]